MRNNFLRDCTTGGVGGRVGRLVSGTGGGLCFGTLAFREDWICSGVAVASIDLDLGGACLIIFSAGAEIVWSRVSVNDLGCSGGGGGAARVGFGGDSSKGEDGGNEGFEDTDETGSDGCDAA